MTNATPKARRVELSVRKLLVMAMVIRRPGSKSRCSRRGQVHGWRVADRSGRDRRGTVVVVGFQVHVCRGGGMGRNCTMRPMLMVNMVVVMMVVVMMVVVTTLAMPPRWLQGASEGCSLSAVCNL